MNSMLCLHLPISDCHLPVWRSCPCGGGESLPFTLVQGPLMRARGSHGGCHVVFAFRATASFRSVEEWTFISSFDNLLTQLGWVVWGAGGRL